MYLKHFLDKAAESEITMMVLRGGGGGGLYKYVI